jgi:predicted nucleic acid-binding protein
VIGALVDTGFLVALFRRNDSLRSAAREYLRQHTHPLATVSPVIVESCFFLDPRAQGDLLEWVIRGALAVADVPPDAYPELKVTIAKYAGRDLDFADAALVWFAAATGCRKILTVDERDFELVRIKGNKRFEIVSWTNESRR